MRKWMLRIMVMMLVFASVPMANVQAATKKQAAYKAYNKYIKKSIPEKYEEYAIIDLDNDKISEVVCLFIA